MRVRGNEMLMLQIAFAVDGLLFLCFLVFVILPKYADQRVLEAPPPLRLTGSVSKLAGR